MKKINKLLLLMLMPLFTLGQISTLPHSSDFEVGFGDWTQSTFDDFDWTHTTTSTPSVGTGPQVGPPFGYDGSSGYVFTESSPNKNQNKQAWLECQYDFSLYSNIQFTFAYHLYSIDGGSYGPGTLQLDVYDGTSWTYNLWSNSTSDIDWRTATVDLSDYDGLSNVILSWTGATEGWQSDISLDNLEVTGDNTKITSYPYEADFENETQHSTDAAVTGFTFTETGWRNIGGDGTDWRADAGGTPSVDTGPGSGAATGASDHTPGTSMGFYLYFESSSPNYPDINAYLLSPIFDLTSNAYPVLEFWYNMYGAGMGSFKMQISTDGGSTWSADYMNITGDQGSEWKQAILDLVDFRGETNLVFRFEAESSADWNSDICLDNFRLLDMSNDPLDVYINLNLSSDAFDASSTTINIVGSSAQSIRSNGHSFSTININNTSGVTLTDAMTTNRMILTDGIVEGSLVTITSTLWSALSGGSNSSYIKGTLRRYIAANTDTYGFPVGHTSYFKADFINNNLNLPGSTDFIQMSVAIGSETGDDVDINLTATQGGTAITDVYENAIWTITPSMGGSFLSGDYGLNLYTDNLTGLEDNKFTIVKRSDASTTYADWSTHDDITAIPSHNASGRKVSDGYSKKTGFDSFSKAAIAGGNNNLPIELLDFNAVTNEGTVYLTWTTLSEVNNDYFTMEKNVYCCTEDDSWQFVGEIDGAGNSNEIRYYNMIDLEPFDGPTYYRLKQTDFDGNYEYSGMVVVELVTDVEFSIQPNPADDRLELIFGTLDGGINIMTEAHNAKIKIHDVQGRLVYKKKFDGNFYRFNIDVSNFVKGVYFVTFESNGKINQTKFVKE